MKRDMKKLNKTDKKKTDGTGFVRRRLLPKKKRIIVSMLSIMAILGTAFFLFRVIPRPQIAVELATPVRIIKPQFGDLQRTLRLDGHIEPRQSVTLMPLASGVIDSVFVDAGARVKKGQLLAKINSTAYELQRSQAKSAYLMSKSTFERLEQLKKSDAVSRQDFDAARAQYEAYKSQYDLAQLQVDNTLIEAPIDGIILMRHLNMGDLASPQRPLFTIGDLDSLVVRAKIPEEHYELFQKLKLDMKIDIRRRKEDVDSYSATIDKIAPFISAESRNFEVTCALEEGIETLRPGMSIYIDFILEEKKDIYFLPYKTLLSDSHVWFLDRDNLASIKGHIADESKELKESGSEGDDSNIPLTISRFLFDGKKLIVKNMELPRLFRNDQYFQIPESESDLLFLIEGQHLVADGQNVRVVR